ncbi:LacI family DNA-binding transcriptional regulator [Luteipulveratus mongoliensis]|uniref:HTH deoR-type domain-containing protein n=1 Tax=Luteipulveratus mongoliensis TaxID=571913 RepID=A0A0K1JGB1_9MICO|nr:substrate-binding domain-containing protein [Luteipulveratus mongoliensis]AKU15633.1 hypothetical protein VV02_06825 [Luteipulveratus mongoliensis]
MRLAAERRAAILRTARLRGSVRVTEVAEALGVSTVTIRRDVTALVDEGVLERVHGGATLAPDPDQPAAGPRRALRATIGLVVPSATYYYPAVIRGAEAAAAAQGVRLVLAISNYYESEERRQVSRLIEIGVDGILLATSKAPDDDAELTRWVGSVPVPTVLIERQADVDAGVDVEHVRSDHAAGARLAIRHLVELGHSAVALASQEGTPTARWLFEGYRQAVARGMIADGIDPILLPPADAVPELRAAALTEVLDRCEQHGIRAVLVHNDKDAMDLVRIAAARGLRVPDDLAIVAYDDEVAALCDVPLTAVAPPKREVGRLGVELMMQRLTQADHSVSQRISLLPRLIVRSSCGGDASSSSDR